MEQLFRKLVVPELATLAAFGADPAQLGALVAGETSVVGLAGMAEGIVTGDLMRVTILGILAGTSDLRADLPNLPLPAVGLVV